MTSKRRRHTDGDHREEEEGEGSSGEYSMSSVSSAAGTLPEKPGKVTKSRRHVSEEGRAQESSLESSESQPSVATTPVRNPSSNDADVESVEEEGSSPSPPGSCSCCHQEPCRRAENGPEDSTDGHCWCCPRRLAPSTPRTPQTTTGEGLPIRPQTESDVTFESLGVCEELLTAIKSVGWTRPTPVQAKSLPHTLGGLDIIGLAETGSGKTGAFVIPVIQTLLGLPTPQRLFCVALAPTRELCVQIAEQFEALGHSICLEVTTIVGGLNMVDQACQLARKPHVVVASPGRLVDHLENTKGFSLKSVQYLIMDEADRLLSMDFEEALTKILRAVPKKRHTYLFSATMTSKVSKLQRVSLQNPVKVEVSSKFDTVKNLVQSWALVPAKDKYVYAAGLLMKYRAYSAMIFTNTCKAAVHLAVFLRHLGFQSVALHGQMTQPQRLAALTQFKSKNKKILVATEVASRGLDIPHVDLVVNFDVASSAKAYIHRVGRTARANRAGKSVTIVSQYDVEPFKRIEQALGYQLDLVKDVNDAARDALRAKCRTAFESANQEIDEGTEGSKTEHRRGGRGGHGRGKKRIKT